MLYVNPNVTSDLMALSSQEHMLLTKTVSQNVAFSFIQRVETVVTEIDPETVEAIKVIAQERDAFLYPKTRLVVANPLTDTEIPLTVSDFGLGNLNAENVTSDLIIEADDTLASIIASTPLSFTEVTEGNELLDDLYGKVPVAYDEIVVSNYIADLILNNVKVRGDGIRTYQDLLNSGLTFDLTGHYPVRIVGIVEYETPILKSDTTALDTVASNVYVNKSFLNRIPLKAITDSYGLVINKVSDLNGLTQAIKNTGSVTILPNYTGMLNRYTRYDLTLVISVLVPLLGYLALVFLGNYISSSILFRKRQIGILRAIGNYIANVEHVFRFEAIAVGFIVMILVYFLVPYFVNIVNFAFMVHFQDTFISLYHYSIYSVGVGSLVEIFFLLVLLITMLTFTLTHNINLIDPVDVISGR
jgi:ABC-type antimicrobial peptide transport system permease subunit